MRAIRIGVVSSGVLLAAVPAPADSPSIGEWGVDLTGRNPEVPAGDDFFRHANGTWLDEFEIPEDLPQYGSFVELFLRCEERVVQILDDARTGAAGDGREAGMVGDLYADYLDTDAIEAAALAPIEADLKRIRGAKTHEEIADLLAFYSRTGGRTPFDYHVDQDAKNPTRYLAHFRQTGLALPDRDYYLVEDNPRFQRAREAYLECLEEVLGAARWESPATAAEQVLALETQLARAHWPAADTRDVDRTYNKLTPESVRADFPGFPWECYLATLGLDQQEEMIVATPSAYAGMAGSFRETPVASWRAYIVAGLLLRESELLPATLDRAAFTFQSKAVTGAREQRPRARRAAQFVNRALGEAVGREYVARHFPPESKEAAERLVANLFRAMGERIDALVWMSEETKGRAREKLSRFSVKIGYPDEWRDYSTLEIRRGDLVGNARRCREFEYARNLEKLGQPVDRDEWFMGPQTVNAYYNPPMNEIVFPAAILEPPFFDPHADPAVNYGGIGAVIGHEIGHGFDDQGRKSDGEGVLRDWWTQEDAERFQERADRLVEQYNAFSPLEGMTVNGQLTLGENIGDVGGIEIAHHAYRLACGGEEPPVLDGLTGDQRFFLGFAQIWRGKARDEMMAARIASDPHSPVEFRVNGTVRNVDAWYEAFHVGPGAAMYLSPEARVHIW